MLGPSWFRAAPGRAPHNLQCARATQSEKMSEKSMNLHQRGPRTGTYIRVVTGTMGAARPLAALLVIAVVVVRDAPPPQPPPKPPDVAFSEGGAACSSRRARMAARREPPFASTSEDFTSARASAACRSAVVPSSAQKGHGASDDVRDAD